MDTWKYLNDLYQPLHERAQKLCAAMREQGFSAKFVYANLHEVWRNGGYQTEFFPMPEIELLTPAGRADLGLTLDGGAWFELHISRARALTLDYPALTAAFTPEIYGSEAYLTDFYNATLSAEAVKEKISASQETEICINLTITSNEDPVRKIIEFLSFI